MIVAGDTASAGGFISARLSKSYPPLAAELDVGDALAELDRRTQAITAEIAQTESRLLHRPLQTSSLACNGVNPHARREFIENYQPPGDECRPDRS